MPTYEYTCRRCGHTFEIVQSMKDDTLTVCPVCGGELRKIFAPPVITFKGSGFYATDHGKKKAPAGADTGADKGAEKTDTKKEGMPASKEAAAHSGSGDPGSSGSGSSSGSGDSGSSGSAGSGSGSRPGDRSRSAGEPSSSEGSS
jgi:putative FmdB family regulatory protein